MPWHSSFCDARCISERARHKKLIIESFRGLKGGRDPAICRISGTSAVVALRYARTTWTFYSGDVPSKYRICNIKDGKPESRESLGLRESVMKGVVVGCPEAEAQPGFRSLSPELAHHIQAEEPLEPLHGTPPCSCNCCGIGT